MSYCIMTSIANTDMFISTAIPFELDLYFLKLGDFSSAIAHLRGCIYPCILI